LAQAQVISLMASPNRTAPSTTGHNLKMNQGFSITTLLIGTRHYNRQRGWVLLH
jgi:hypothetical protein